MTKVWNHDSGVAVCGLCGGAGEIPSSRRPIDYDPYPSNECECGLGPHEPECPVCGYDQMFDGWDCIACEIIETLLDREIPRLNIESLAKALGKAREAKLASIREDVA